MMIQIWLLFALACYPLLLVLVLFVTPAEWHTSDSDWDNVAGAGGDWRGSAVAMAATVTYGAFVLAGAYLLR